MEALGVKRYSLLILIGAVLQVVWTSSPSMLISMVQKCSSENSLRLKAKSDSGPKIPVGQANVKLVRKYLSVGAINIVTATDNLFVPVSVVVGNRTLRFKSSLLSREIPNDIESAHATAIYTPARWHRSFPPFLKQTTGRASRRNQFSELKRKVCI